MKRYICGCHPKANDDNCLNLKGHGLYESDFQTTPEYWDCECEKNYIHDKMFKTCKRCKTQAINQPDSRVNEVKAMKRKHSKEFKDAARSMGLL